MPSERYDDTYSPNSNEGFDAGFAQEEVDGIVFVEPEDGLAPEQNFDSKRKGHTRYSAPKRIRPMAGLNRRNTGDVWKPGPKINKNKINRSPDQINPIAVGLIALLPLIFLMGLIYYFLNLYGLI